MVQNDTQQVPSMMYALGSNIRDLDREFKEALLDQQNAVSPKGCPSIQQQEENSTPPFENTNMAVQPQEVQQQQNPLMDLPEPVICSNMDIGSVAKNSDDVLVAPPNEPSEPFINVYMIIDPKNNTCYVPRQIISFKGDDGVSSTAMFGPQTLQKPKSSSFMIEGNIQDNSVVNKTNHGGSQEIQRDEEDDDSSIMPPPSMVTPPSSITDSSIDSSVSPTFPSSARMIVPAAYAEIKNTTGAFLPPLRHLSAYNFFFRDERDRLLNGSDPDWSAEKAQRLLEEHWAQNRTKKRRHRKTHGKIDFTSLSKLISKRWKELPEDRKDFYRQIASRDFERFKRETNDLPVERSTASASSPPHAMILPIMTTHTSVVG